MSRNSLWGAGAVALLVLAAPGAGAASFGLPTRSDPAGGLVQQVHSVYDAEETLYRRGYYDVRLERATLPYSFNACKRGVRYHIHVNYFGDLVQVDPLGPCDRDDEGHYGRRRYYERYRSW